MSAEINLILTVVLMVIVLFIILFIILLKLVVNFQELFNDICESNFTLKDFYDYFKRKIKETEEERPSLKKLRKSVPL